MVGSKAMMKKEFTDWLTQAAVKVTMMMMMMMMMTSMRRRGEKIVNLPYKKLV